jgi:galactokinase
MSEASELQLAFQRRFGEVHGIYRAPGRVNLIGEHTDYNRGFVLPAALDLSCWVAAGPRSDSRLGVYSENAGEFVEFDLRKDALQPSAGWRDYPAGVAWALLEAGFPLRGANLYIRGQVPLGAGLSSSAALEVATGYALLDVAGQSVDLRELALYCQHAENDFVGARCGIMDQFIACHGRAGNALLLDCRSLEFQLVPMPRGISVVVCNSMVKHEIAAGEYNLRREQCEEGVRLLASSLPGISSLRDVTLEALERNKAILPERIYRRCHHVVSENERTLATASALREGKLARVGELMLASHVSLREDYEVSCPELDLLVDLARRQGGVVGARMTGGGFGGCTVNLVRSELTHACVKGIASAYQAEAGRPPEIYPCLTANGVQRVC